MTDTLKNCRACGYYTDSKYKGLTCCGDEVCKAVIDDNEEEMKKDIKMWSI